MLRRWFISVMGFMLAFETSAQSDGILLTADRTELTERSSHEAKPEAHSSAPDINRLYAEGKKGKMILGYASNNLPVEAYFFPGTSDKKALIIAGVHGSELASIDVARMIIAQLETNERPYYNVVIIPSLFPANAEKALSKKDSNTNFGRYTSNHHVDPNRQMPLLGQAFDEANPLDACGRLIENENRYLLALIQMFQPTRIVNLHAIKDTSRAGIFADPRTDCQGIALGYASDSVLALTMANFIREKGGAVPGNYKGKSPSALYYKDPAIVEAGTFQKRNLLGAVLNDDRGAGVSLGSWATTAVCDQKAPRDAMRLFTIEFPGYQSYMQCVNEDEIQKRFMNVYLYAAAVTGIFLDNIHAE